MFKLMIIDCSYHFKNEKLLLFQRTPFPSKVPSSSQTLSKSAHGIINIGNLISAFFFSSSSLYSKYLLKYNHSLNWILYDSTIFIYKNDSGYVLTEHGEREDKQDVIPALKDLYNLVDKSKKEVTNDPSQQALINII